MLALDALAKEHGVAAVVDCGVSPGLSNLCVGHGFARLDEVYEAVIYVGGLPKVRRPPFEYKAPFAPRDVIAEYTRPARMIVGGRLETRRALSERECLDLPHVGTLEAFNTDGLRTLLTTMRIPNMIEKTLRYPGHARLMETFRDAGFFSEESVELDRQRVRPIDLTAQLLFPLWRLKEGEEEFTVLRVEVAGAKGGRSVVHRYDLYDETDASTGTTSMARTTGFPCAIVARMLLSGEIKERGVMAPERLGQQRPIFDSIVDALQRRGVELNHRELARG